MNKPVYANPMQPDICPLLELAVLVLSTYHGNESVYVFGDSEQNAEKKYARYTTPLGVVAYEIHTVYDTPGCRCVLDWWYTQQQSIRHTHRACSIRDPWVS